MILLRALRLSDWLLPHDLTLSDGMRTDQHHWWRKCKPSNCILPWCLQRKRPVRAWIKARVLYNANLHPIAVVLPSTFTTQVCRLHHAEIELDLTCHSIVPKSYTIPGPRPFTCDGSSGTTTTTKPPSGTTTTTTKTSSSTTTSAVGGTVAQYGQCGGKIFS